MLHDTTITMQHSGINSMVDKKPTQRGPKPERVKTDDDFDTVIQRALKKKPLRDVDTGDDKSDSDDSETNETR